MLGTKQLCDIVARTLLLTSLIAALSTSLAQGSFSLELSPLSLSAELNIEQTVTTLQGGTLYGGSGFAYSPADGVQKLQPYLMWCDGVDAFLAYVEVCAELRAPIIGEGSIVATFVSIVW